MKQTALSLTLIAAMFLPALSRAETTISLGGTAWYVWWKPAWSDNRWQGYYLWNDSAGYWNEDAKDFGLSSNIMAGPIISIGFLDRWSISSVAVLGTMSHKASGVGFGTDVISRTAGATHKDYSRRVLKWDSDTTVGCAVHKYVKLYAGFKAQGYRYQETIHYYDFTAFPDISIDHSEGTNNVNCYGPGLGISGSIPLVENLYMVIGLSGVVLWCTERGNTALSRTYGLESSGFVFTCFYMPRGKFLSYGGTAALSLAYTIARINTTFSLGGRYQLLYNRQKRGNMVHSDVTMNIIDGQYDHFAGITLSVLYTFHIGKREQS
ncbi:MAG TPA: hypothetical protein PLM53_03935 [Spirochaetota bacterium]|nr:hypothetical protein [Spirochaetota bacterium]HPC40199.1 hypothetical protein [Spirochaetota bacterium]HPL16179.1 hypothetical protein [Spirochaetota bacterium]HQF07327.1 hypothetical protein [Spirochaetota bacterium]HQH96228.1 hypothetical protein [Spirochaetota bacterium]